jgi:hypothetical protein
VTEPAESPEVKALVGQAEVWSDPPGGQAIRQVVADANRGSLETSTCLKRMAGDSGAPSLWNMGEGQCRRRRTGSCCRRAPRGHRGRHGGKEQQRKLGTTSGSPRRTCTAKASRINRTAAKSRCAREWGGWGRISVDGAGQNNPVRSEGPWGRATEVARTAVRNRVLLPDTERNDALVYGTHEGQMKTTRRRGYARCRLNRLAEWEVAVRKAGLEAVLGKTRRTEF